MFACVSRAADRYGKEGVGSVIVTLCLPVRLDSPRIVAVSEPYPDRWTHHILVAQENELDDELMGWIALSYDYSCRRGRVKQ